MKRKKRKRLRFIIKTALSIIYIAIAGILCLVSFKLYEKDQEIVKWKDVEKTSQYSYIEISEMSEAFAEIKGKEKTVHFVIEKEETGAWHTYLIAIKKSDYEKYKKLIDKTYRRTEEEVPTIKVYGYPVLINKDIKALAIKNINNFLPIENQIVLDEQNFEQYLTNTYLDTTKEEMHRFNNIILILLLMALVLFILLVFTIFDKDKIVDEVDEFIEKEEKKLQKKKKKEAKKQKKKSPKTVENKSKTEPKEEKQVKPKTQQPKKDSKKVEVKNEPKKIEPKTEIKKQTIKTETKNDAKTTTPKKEIKKIEPIKKVDNNKPKKVENTKTTTQKQPVKIDDDGIEIL